MTFGMQNAGIFVFRKRRRAMRSASAAFVEEAPETFLPIPGGSGRMGHTHIRLAAAREDVLEGVLRTAWKLRVEKNAKRSGNRRTPPLRRERNNR